jgi:hypothetical protein
MHWLDIEQPYSQKIYYLLAQHPSSRRLFSLHLCWQICCQTSCLKMMRLKEIGETSGNLLPGAVVKLVVPAAVCVVDDEPPWPNNPPPKSPPVVVAAGVVAGFGGKAKRLLPVAGAVVVFVPDVPVAPVPLAVLDVVAD